MKGDDITEDQFVRILNLLGVMDDDRHRHELLMMVPEYANSYENLQQRLTKSAEV